MRDSAFDCQDVHTLTTMVLITPLAGGHNDCMTCSMPGISIDAERKHCKMEKVNTTVPAELQKQRVHQIQYPSVCRTLPPGTHAKRALCLACCAWR